MDDINLQDIRAAVKDLARRIRPELSFEPKYGGEVFVPDPMDPKRFVGGVFLYKDHVSVEFSNGAGFDDPDGLLEGKGKARRHLKLHTLADIDAKQLDGFLRQALA